MGTLLASHGARRAGRVIGLLFGVPTIRPLQFLVARRSRLSRTAVACFAGIVLLLVTLVLVSGKSTLLGRAPLPLPPDVPAFKAREMLKQFGYTEEPVDSAYGFLSAFGFTAYIRYLRAHDFDHPGIMLPAINLP